MPGLEILVGQRLKDSEALKQLLPCYHGQPAVFYQLAPEDTQTGWERAEGTPPDAPSQYPRLVYDFNKLADTERKSSGTLAVFVFCDSAGTEPETLETLIKERLKDVLMKPEGGFPYCFAWSRTDTYEIPGLDQGATNRRIVGQEIDFDIIEYPMQETADPDPVAALNNFLQAQYPEAVIVDLTRMGAFTEASAERPVVYCRLQGITPESTSNMTAWMNARIAVHIICPDPETRLKLAADIQSGVTALGEMRMLDRSIMWPIRVELNNTADYLKEGQIDGLFRYGIMRWRAKPHRLNRVRLGLNPEAYIEDYSRT